MCVPLPVKKNKKRPILAPAASPRSGAIVILSVNGKLQMAVNPRTRKVEQFAQQFRCTFSDNAEHFGIEALRHSEYIKAPKVLQVTQ